MSMSRRSVLFSSAGLGVVYLPVFICFHLFAFKAKTGR